jgi:prolyl-tRNA synthetase
MDAAMRWTKYLIPTTKEVPAEAVVASHRLMLRAGMIRQIAAGSYAYLPLGWRVLHKVTEIIRQEMDRAGAVELFMPAMHPVELWQETGRVEAMGDTLIHLPDRPWRKGTVLGPTHEEIITEIARAYLNSYKQLPLTLYQIQTKFRDEQRPKSGILRTREFLMKDAYSFDLDLAGLDASYNAMYDAYCRIYSRCGLPYLAVEAESGAMGGDASAEFMVATEAGEDFLVRNGDGTYCANLERATMAPMADVDPPSVSALQEVHTPGHTTIEQVSAFLKCRPTDMIKTIIYHADGKPLVALVRGDHTVNEAKLARAAGVAELEPATPDQIRTLTGAEVGFAGPVGLKARIIADQAVTVMHNAVTGANKTEYHVTGVNIGRDFEIIETADIRYPVEGDCAPDGSALLFEKCVEVGHVFKLGTKYTDSMKAQVLDEHGKSRAMIMGCYGIGVNRIIAAAIETHHDEGGIRWPMSIAPFCVQIVSLDARDEQVSSLATRVHDELESRGIDVLLDDRDARPGFKFKDADLIGIPLRITIGKRGLDEGIVEVKRRSEDEVRKLPPNEVVNHVACIVEAERSGSKWAASG